MNLNPLGMNQTELEVKEGFVLFSYRTPVAAHIDGKCYRTEKYWSRTTTEHINKWLSNSGYTTIEQRPQDYFDNLLAEVNCHSELVQALKNAYFILKMDDEYKEVAKKFESIIAKAEGL